MFGAGDGVESDQVDTAVEAAEQPGQGIGMPQVVVDVAPHDVFKRQSSLMTEVTLPEQLNDLGYGIGCLHRHQSAPLLRIG